MVTLKRPPPTWAPSHSTGSHATVAYDLPVANAYNVQCTSKYFEIPENR